MKLDILTIFPGYFDSPLGESLIAKASERGILDIRLWDIRSFATDRHRTVDDQPYGGGAGMVMKIQPVHDCLSAVVAERGDGFKVLLTPRGTVFDQRHAGELSRKDHLIFICGRYEGIDARIESFIDASYSIGDYVTMGGEVAALVMTEAVVRLVDGVVGKEDSVRFDSFSGGLLEHPQYTRPPEYLGLKVPDVLLSGNHEDIRRWREVQSYETTGQVRPDLLGKGTGDAC